MRLRIGLLWTWWFVCSVFLLCLWAWALSSRKLALLDARQLTVTAHVRELGQAFASIQKLQLALLASGHWDAERLRLARTQAEPYCHLYLNDAPVWMMALLKPRIQEGVFFVRPQPPGLEAGRFSAEEAALPADAPGNYLLACLSVENGLLISELNLDYVFGPWLRQQTGLFGLGNDVHARFLEDEPLQPAPWRLHPFFGDDPHPFGLVEVQLDNGSVLQENLRLHLLALAGGGLLMASFAVSIALAARGMRRELEYAEARSRFTAMVSHELRTPVAAVRMYADILQNGLVDDPERIAHYHRIIGEESARLGRMVESLLELGAIERGARSFQLQAVDLNAMVRKALPPDSEAELLLQEDLPPARADAEATLQVLENLIANALKYGGNPVQLTIASHASAAAVVVDVMDRGPGIPLGDRKKIFQAYHRLPGATPQRGVGLGLAIVKGYMDGQGGSVEVSEREGGGAIFTIALPVSR